MNKKKVFAILDMPENKVYRHVAFGPLDKDQIVSIPSARLVWYDEGDSAHSALKRRFEAPSGFTLVSDSISTYSCNSSNGSDSPVYELAKKQFGLEVEKHRYGYGSQPPKNKDGVELVFYGVYKYWRITIQDRELLHEIARKVPVIFNRVAYERTGRRKGFVVKELYHGWEHNLATLEYNLALWKKRVREREEDHADRMSRFVHKSQLRADEANDIYWGMAEVLRSRMLGKNSGNWWQWDGPGRSKESKMKAIIGLTQLGRRLFGKNFWVRRLSKVGSSYRYQVDPDCPGSKKWDRVSPIPYIRRRHRKLKLKRPPKEQKYARAIWDLIHPPKRRRPATGSPRTSSASPKRTTRSATGRRTSASRKKTTKKVS